MRWWLGGLGSWVLSGFTPRASQTSHVQLWPKGLGQEARHWSKHIWNVMGTLSLVCLCVLRVCLCGEAVANRRPTVIQCGRPFHDPSHQHPPPPLPPLNSPPSSPDCALWPCVSSRSTLCKMHTQDLHTHRHKHTHGFDQTGMHGPPVKRCDGNSK